MTAKVGTIWVWLGAVGHFKRAKGKEYAVSAITADTIWVEDDAGVAEPWRAEVFDEYFGPAEELTAETSDVKAELADEAKRIVSGARRSAYGTPEQNFERIARFWQAYFENTGRGDVKITAADVSPLMRLMKEARLCETPDHRDSHVDLIGYTLTGAEVAGVKPLTPDKSSDNV